MGCLVDSCMSCRMCNKGEEQYCENGFTMTYDWPMPHGHIATDHAVTYGGYSEKMTVSETDLVDMCSLSAAVGKSNGHGQSNLSFTFMLPRKCLSDPKLFNGKPKLLQLSTHTYSRCISGTPSRSPIRIPSRPPDPCSAPGSRCTPR